MATVLPIASVARRLAARPSGASRVHSAVRAFPLALAVTLLAASGVLAGNGASTVHFTASYDSFTCAGERIVKTAPKGFTKDSETCTFTDVAAFPTGTYDIVGQAVPESPTQSHWASDYDILYTPAGSPGCIVGPPICVRVAVSGTIVVTDNGDGTGTLVVVAYY